VKFTLKIVGPAALVVLGSIVALLVASGATGLAKAKAPENTKEPVIASQYLVKVGSTLQGNKGTWTGKEPITYSYQWLRCNEDAEACTKISGATETSYTIVQDDVGHTIRFQVTAKNAAGSDTAKSDPTQEIAGKAGAPQATSPPVITGTPTVGQELSTTNGNWNGSKPITYSISWQRCNTAVTDCTDLGKSGPTYTLVAGDAGHRMRTKLKASNSDGQSSALSVPTAIVQQGGGGGGGGGGSVVDVKDVGPAGERLVVDKVVFNPNPVTSKSVPIHVTITVKDTNGKLVKGALVFLRSTPVVASIPTDAPTGSNGTVSYSIQPESDFPIKNSYSVQFFVKAYRQGDPSLAGISGTRLVQVKTHKP
jgi:hypothetical protein